MRLCRCALAFLAVSLAGAPSNGASAQASESKRGAASCFEMILPQRQIQLNSPLLFNRCTGATWLLVRNQGTGGSARSTYRWVSLEVDDPLPARSKGGIDHAPKPAGVPSAGSKCFEFSGRRFCE
jgi:hypothetical protein